MLYTYQNWPISIRGQGWPSSLDYKAWPAAGTDDTIRVPLVLFTPGGAVDVLSPLDHPIQQIAALDAPHVPAPAYGDYPSYHGGYGPTSQEGHDPTYHEGGSDELRPVTRSITARTVP